jgi:Trypsin-like peptidase domain
MIPSSLKHYASAAAALLASGAALAVPMVGDSRAPQPGAFPATGHVRCAGGMGTAQLVGSTQVIVTAGHVLIGRGGRGSGCTVTFVMNGERRRFAIDMAQLRAGSDDPLGAPAARDWAVARLAAPVEGVRPFATGFAAMGQQVTLVSGRTLAASGAPTAESCRIRGRARGGGELAIDCSAQAGDSGAALLTADGRVAAIYVGFRSLDPGRTAPFSDTHYNFALPISGAIASAIRELAR